MKPQEGIPYPTQNSNLNFTHLQILKLVKFMEGVEFLRKV